MNQYFQFDKGTDYFITDLNTPGNYLPESDSLLGYIHDKDGNCKMLTTVKWCKLRPASLPITFGNRCFWPNQMNPVKPRN